MDDKKVSKSVSEACAWAIRNQTTFELDMMLQVYVLGQFRLSLVDKKSIIKTIAEVEGAGDLPAE